jgi:enediyne biosynthesis protein E4
LRIAIGLFRPVIATHPDNGNAQYQLGNLLLDAGKVQEALDNDGDLDIVTNDFNSEPMVLISDLAQQKKIHWLKVVLVGTKSNRNGLGATVHVHSGGQTYTRYNDGKSGYLSQSVLPLYFGLGDTSKIDSIDIAWPSGRKQVLRKDLTDNQTLKVTEPDK